MEKFDIPEAEEVTIELNTFNIYVDKSKLKSIVLRLKSYLYSRNELVKSGYSRYVPMTVILGIDDPYITERAEILVKTTKPNGEVQITGKTRILVEARP